jgi:DNA-binding NarL/FixJ family response regulator
MDLPADSSLGIGNKNGLIRVLIVDDHALVREGTVQLLERELDMRVVGQASTGVQAILLVDRLSIDVVLLDVNLPDTSGLEVAKLIVSKHPEIRVLIVSAYDDYAYVAEALDLGVAGYLLKTATGRELVDAVRTVAGGDFVLSGSISLRLAHHRQTDHQTNEEKLTPRELDVLRLLGKGLTNKGIANRLGLTLRTVEGYVSNVLAKLGASSRTEAALYAVSRHLIPLNQNDESTNSL